MTKPIAEIRDVTRRLTISRLLRASEAGHLVNSIRAMATWITRLPQVDAASDPNDDFLLALAQAGHADYLLSGDKRSLLSLGVYGTTKIMTAREFVESVLDRQNR